MTIEHIKSFKKRSSDKNVNFKGFLLLVIQKLTFTIIFQEFVSKL